MLALRNLRAIITLLARMLVLIIYFLFSFAARRTLNNDMDCDQRSEALSGPHWKADVSSISSDKACPATCRVPAKALDIIWGNDPRFWQMIKLSEVETRPDGFDEGARLIQVNWFKVTGKLPTAMFNVASPTKYQVYYVMKFQVDAFGWHSAPIKFEVRLNGQKTEKNFVLESYKKKPDVWHEICGGEFTVSNDADGDVDFAMSEVESEWWKGSVVLAGIKIRPKEG